MSLRSRFWAQQRNMSIHFHTCHISQREIKSQNLAHLDRISHKNSNLKEFSDHFRFYEEININHTLLWFSQASYIKKRHLDFMGVLQSDV